MPFKVIKGTFHVRGYSPDGDSIRFRPDDLDLILDLPGPPPDPNPRNHVQLRLEAIDSLETHFTPRGGSALNQPLALAHASTDRLLDFVGITDVEWNDARTLVTGANDGTRGYILSRSVEKNGRPVAFVYAGDPPEADGDDVMLEEGRLRDSFNYAALAEGLAYPTYYRGLFSDLRDAMTAAAEEARNGGRGVFAEDRTNEGFRASNLSSITRRHVILPKLFRRLSEYMVNFDTAVGFKRKLEQSREPVLDLRTSNFTHFDTFVEQANNSDEISLTRLPEELVFDEMPARPSGHFSLLLAVGEDASFGEGQPSRRDWPDTQDAGRRPLAD
ncbi:MAG: nuclease [Acidobacteriota bacterium]|nr:nuclease [Acidobacteriota bacterium]